MVDYSRATRMLTQAAARATANDHQPEAPAAQPNYLSPRQYRRAVVNQMGRFEHKAAQRQLCKDLRGVWPPSALS